MKKSLTKVNWKKAEEFLIKDKYIGPLIKKYGSCEIKPRQHIDYFHALVGEIVGQQLSGKVADIIFDRLTKRTKGRLTPENILALSEEELRACGMSWSKVSFVRDLASRVKNGELDIKGLQKLSDEEIRKELIAVKGIGNWTIDMFLMFTLARPDVFPNGDLGIKKGIQKILRKELISQEMVIFAERWKPYRTVASWYVWKAADSD